MGKRSGTEISVAPKISGNHIQTKLKSFSHTAPETFGAVQGKEHVTAALERQQLITRQALGNQHNSEVFRSTSLQPRPFGTETPGRKCFDQQGNLLRKWMTGALTAERGW